MTTYARRLGLFSGTMAVMGGIIGARRGERRGGESQQCGLGIAIIAAGIPAFVAWRRPGRASSSR